MKWTKAHSASAVAARRRLRILRATAEPQEHRGKVFTPRTTPDFVINIRSRSGERVQITALRYGKAFITSDGLKSARSIGRGVEMLLRHYTESPE